MHFYLICKRATYGVIELDTFIHTPYSEQLQFLERPQLHAAPKWTPWSVCPVQFTHERRQKAVIQVFSVSAAILENGRFLLASHA